MAARGPQNGRHGLERVVSLDFRALPSTFAKWVFDPRSRSIRKGCDDEEKKKKKWKKRIVKIVVH